MMVNGKSTMKAVVLLGPEKFEVREIEIPQPAYDEVLCAIESVAICGSDPKFIKGETAGTWPPYYPFVIGHEWAGRVVALGENVKNLRIGDRVAGEAHNGCGYCAHCKAGMYNLCDNYGKKETGHRHYGHSSTGSYAEYGVYSKRSLTPIPENVSYDEASIIDAAGTGMHAVELTGITPGGTVAIIGPGPIGMITARLAKAMGAGKVIMIGRGGRLQSSKKLCADHIVDIETAEVEKQVRDLTGGSGCDEVFECSGAKGTILRSIRIAKKGGRIGLLGIPAPGSVSEIDDRALILNQITIYGSRANPNVSEKLLNMVSRGALKISDLITHSFPIDDFAEGLGCFVNRRDGALKVIIHPQAK
ncbi:MAG: alcohol dehydrogenase catalytic domain-containing protein [Rectinemataceae bacterium]